MRNPALEYPGDGGCSYALCPNRPDSRLKRGSFMPLGEITMWSTGIGIHVECMKHITRIGGVLDDLPQLVYDPTEDGEKGVRDE